MKKITNVKEYIGIPLLYNHWYVAGKKDEFTQTPKAKTLLEKSIVFYRIESGELVALQNRCLHRAYPLSKGKLEGDNIVCGYHGARYNPEGELVRVPCQNRVPTLKLRKYTVREIGPFVMIWMGEGEPDNSKFPLESVSHLDNANFRTIDGYHHVKGNYLFMQENLHDLTHIPYLHRDTFQVDDRFLESRPEVSQTERGVLARRVHEESTVRHFFSPSVLKEVEGKDLWRVDYGISPSPGIYEAKIITGIGNKEGDCDEKEHMNQYLIHFLTPETKSTCHYWFSVALDHGTSVENDPFWAMFPKFFEAGFLQDLDACDSMQVLLDQETEDFKDVHFSGDQHSLLYRNIVLNWARQEYGDLLVLNKE